MKKSLIPFFAFLILLLLMAPFPFDFASSLVPGCHTVIVSPYFVFDLFIVIAMLLVTMGYWLLSKRVGIINWTLFLIHFVLTLPAIILIRFPTLFLDINADQVNIESYLQIGSLRAKLFPLALVLFIVGQGLFIGYFIKSIRSKVVGR